jgi:hypothetical protein
LIADSVAEVAPVERNLVNTTVNKEIALPLRVQILDKQF